MPTHTPKITAIPISSFAGTQSGKTLPVNLKAFGDFFKLYLQDSGEYAGILNLSVLCGMLKNFTLKIEATLQITQPKPNQRSNKKKLKSSKDHLVRIVLFGLDREKSDVGALLSDADMFLQHPATTECPTGINYSNPHFLLRPGAKMPQLDELSLHSDAIRSAQVDELDEISMARILQIFNYTETNITDFSLNLDPSPRLRSRLMGLAC